MNISNCVTQIFRQRFPEGCDPCLRDQLTASLLSRFLKMVSWVVSYKKSPHIVKVYHKYRDTVWDISVEKYKNYFIGSIPQKNSGKSEYCAKRVVEAAMNNPESVIWCFQTTNENSIQMQQKYIWKYLPKELKEGKIKSLTTYISYSQKNGFSDNKLVLPNGSEIVFRNYAQDISTIEGGEVGSTMPTVENIGVWADELIPQDFLDTLRFRLVTRDAKMLVSFTAIEGYSPVVKEMLNGSKVLEDVEADPSLIRGYRVPLVQQPKRKDARIVYFHTAHNPYGGFERIKKTLEGAHKDDILCRAYGVPTKPLAGKFPKFSHKHNIVEHEKIPFIADKSQEVTHFMCIDPSGAKPWFMIWAGVTPMQEVYIWAEYPDISYGDWADMSRGKRGRPGDAAKPNGYGYDDYIDRINEIEEGVTIFERLIDPRLGAAKYQAEDMQTSIMDELINKGIDVIAAPGYDEDQGLQAINKLLAWDDNKPMEMGNKPRLFISDRCEQLIYAMTEYTGELGKDEPTKDPIDCLRYLAIADIMYINDGTSHVIRTERR